MQACAEEGRGIVKLTSYIHFNLDPNKLTVRKGQNKTTQLLFADMKYTSVFVSTVELLEYLESMTEQVRQIHQEQSPTTL